jgi:NAD(P)-dependent dehydrogenase (short-subunit alcohol dehydrogenase family)
MSIEKQLAGKTALVTGGAAGIGWATACALASDGVNVAICSRPGTTLDNAAEKIERSGFKTITCYQADVTSEENMKDLFTQLKRKFGALDYLVNNAGIDSFCEPEDFSLSQFRHVMDVNVASVFIVISSALPMLREASSPSVVNVGSVHGHVTTSGRADYVTAKTALIGATRALSLDLAAYGIRVNMVSPGAVETPMLVRAWEMKAPDLSLDELRRRAGAEHPTGRIGTPDDIAFAIRFLLGDQAGFINGTDLIVDGGIHTKLALARIWED